MKLERKRNQAIAILLAAVLLIAGLVGCTGENSTAMAGTTTPQDTTAEKEETEGVFIVREGIAEFRPVRVGIAGEEYFEVLSGLQPGDTVVAGPYQTVRQLRTGDAIRPMNTGGGGGASAPASGS